MCLRVLYLIARREIGIVLYGWRLCPSQSGISLLSLWVLRGFLRVFDCLEEFVGGARKLECLALSEAEHLIAAWHVARIAWRDLFLSHVDQHLSLMDLAIFILNL